MTSDNGNQCICTEQKSKAARVRPPTAGYITISPGSEMRVDALEARFSQRADLLKVLGEKTQIFPKTHRVSTADKSLMRLKSTSLRCVESIVFYILKRADFALMGLSINYVTHGGGRGGFLPSVTMA